MSSVPPSGPSSLRGAVDLSSLVNRATQRKAAEARGQVPPDDGAAPVADVVVVADDASFDQILDLSSTVPVLVEITNPGVASTLEPTVRSLGGRVALAVVDATRSPQLVQAFQVQEVPTVAAVIAGRPLALYVGVLPEVELRPLLHQVLQVAAQQGVTGRLEVTDAPAADESADGPAAEPEEPPLPPLHQEAYDAIGRGDYAAAQAAYRTALTQNPRDADAVAGLAQVSLLARLKGAVADAVRRAAAEDPSDTDAQLAVADLDVSGGHLEDAFDRLLDLYPALDVSAKDAVRARILEYFEIAGADDPRVAAARRRLTNLLY